MKRVLVIGGTRFVGRNLVEALLAAGDCEVTLFNRGTTNGHLFPDVPRITGDRETTDVDQVARYDWDAVVDTSCFYPLPLEHLLDVLKGKVGRYIFVSTCSAYDFGPQNIPLTEECPLHACSDSEKTNIETHSYNQRKAECERVLRSRAWLEKIIVRPALIIGRHDYTDRLYYWFHKVQTQSRLLLPTGLDGTRGARLSYLDAEDFARILMTAIGIENQFDVYNACSFDATLADFVEAAIVRTAQNPAIVRASPDFLRNQDVGQWFDLPLWKDSDFTVDNSRLVDEFAIDLHTIESTSNTLIHHYAHDLKWRFPEAAGGQAISAEKERRLIQMLDEKD